MATPAALSLASMSVHQRSACSKSCAYEMNPITRFSEFAQSRKVALLKCASMPHTRRIAVSELTLRHALVSPPQFHPSQTTRGVSRRSYRSQFCLRRAVRVDEFFHQRDNVCPQPHLGLIFLGQTERSHLNPFRETARFSRACAVVLFKWELLVLDLPGSAPFFFHVQSRPGLSLSKPVSCSLQSRHAFSFTLLRTGHLGGALSGSASSFFFLFYSALRQWRRGNIALITTLPVLDRQKLAQHLQPKCLEDRFLPTQTREKGHC